MRAIALLIVCCCSAFICAADGPTPYPDPKDEKAWPGVGPIRVHPWMKDNRAWFWTQRSKDVGKVVFVGDSLTGNWKNLAACFPNLQVANRGIGGDGSRGVLFRFQEDVLDLKPRAIVMCIGSNDLSAHAAPADIIANIAAIVKLARAYDPAMPFVLCTIAPRDSDKAPTKPGAQADINARIKAFGAEQKHFAVLDLVPPLSGADGKPVAAYYAADRLHLAAPGYDVWTKALAPVLESLGVR